MTAVDTLLGKLDHVRKMGDGFVARCPAHEDRMPSLSIHTGADGRVLLRCHAGCEWSEVVAAVGLEPSDLFEPDPHIVYRIKNGAGKVVALHERTDEPDGKRVAWLRPDGTYGLNGTATADLPLFGAHALPPAPGPAVVVTEGEKAAAALTSVGVPAVGTVTGAAGTPSTASLEALRGRHVVLWADRDAVGSEHMQRIGAGLAGVAASVRWATWPEAPEHGDAADLVAARLDPLDVIDAAAPFVAAMQATWVPAPGDALHACTFARAGFRSFALRAPDGAWRLVLSRVDVGEREPRAILTVEAPGHRGAFGDLDGHVLARSVGLFGGANVTAVTKALEARIGTTAEDWARRLDYLVARTLREVQGSGAETMAIDGAVSRPIGGAYVFDGRLRVGRTASLFGPGSAGKTTVADGLVVSAISGVPIIPGWLPTRRFRVGVLDWDEGREEELVRLFAITAGHGIPELTGYRYRRMSRPLPEAADDVGRWVMAEGIEILIVTPVNRAIRQTDRDPSGPIHELYEVLRELGTTNLLIDHVTGANIDKPDATREYGSVAKRDNARGSFSLFEQSQEPGIRVVVIRNAKPDALTPRQSAQAVRITFDPPWPNADGSYDRIRFDPAEVAEPGEAVRVETQHDKLARLLREHGAMGTVELCAVSGFAAAQLHKIADRARAQGYAVRFDRRAERYRLDTHEGAE